MTHNPEELEAVTKAIGKLYGYSASAMARGILDALQPFRDAELKAMAEVILGVTFDAVPDEPTPSKWEPPVKNLSAYETFIALQKDTPEPRAISAPFSPEEMGLINALTDAQARAWKVYSKP